MKDTIIGFGIVFLIVAVVLGLLIVPMYLYPPQKREEFEAFISKRKLDEWLWEGYVTCEFNVRYRDHAGDDGFRQKWAELRDKHAVYYRGDEQLTDAIVDSLYEERVKISHAEPAQTSMPAIRSAWDELEADIEAKRWPVRVE